VDSSDRQHRHSNTYVIVGQTFGLSDLL